MPLINYDKVLQTPLYAVLSTDATITSSVNPSLGELAIKVVDKTRGVSLVNDYDRDRDRQHTAIETVAPAAFLRVTELEAAGWTRSDLRRGTITMNGKSYRIESAKPQSTVSGEGQGELMLILSELA